MSNDNRLCLYREGSVGTDLDLIFVNQSVVPNITSTEDSLKIALDTSIVFLNIVPSSIKAGQFFVSSYF